MTDVLLFIVSIVFLFLGNRAFNLSMKNTKETDPPSDFTDIENPRLMAMSLVFFSLGCWIFYLFIRTQL